MKFRRIIPVTMLTIALAIGSCGTLYADGRTSEEVIRKAQPKPAGYDAGAQKKSKYEQYDRNAEALEKGYITIGNTSPENKETQETHSSPAASTKPSLNKQTSPQVGNTYTSQPHTTFGITENSKNQNPNLLSDYRNHIMVIASVALYKYYDDFENANNWKLMAYDEHNTVIAQDTVTINGKEYPYTYVGTFNLDSAGKISDIQTHLMKLGSDVIEDDGYCKDAF